MSDGTTGRAIASGTRRQRPSVALRTAKATLKEPKETVEELRRGVECAKVEASVAELE